MPPPPRAARRPTSEEDGPMNSFIAKIRKWLGLEKSKDAPTQSKGSP